MPPLKLVALDADDLAIVAAHLQDAVMRLDDIAYRPKAQRFAMVLNRFDWQKALAVGDARTPSNVRRRAAIRFEHVRAVRRQNIAQGSPDAVLSLLTISFEQIEAPAGYVTLVFAGGGAIRLDVEYIEAELRDLGAAWSAAGRPDHEADLSQQPGGPSPRKRSP